jgi:hypothetical protein
VLSAVHKGENDGGDVDSDLELKELLNGITDGTTPCHGFAALALATDPPTPTVLDRRPESKSDPLITLTMWKMIIGPEH